MGGSYFPVVPKPPFWHIEMPAGGSRPLHHKRTMCLQWVITTSVVCFSLNHFEYDLVSQLHLTTLVILYIKPNTIQFYKSTGITWKFQSSYSARHLICTHTQFKSAKFI